MRGECYIYTRVHNTGNFQRDMVSLNFQRANTWNFISGYTGDSQFLVDLGLQTQFFPDTWSEYSLRLTQHGLFSGSES